MLEARTAWAIVLLLAPTGVAAAGTMATVKAPAQHTAYVQLVIDGSEAGGERSELASVEARVACMEQAAIREALDWLQNREGCTTPPGAAIYVTRSTAPSPLEARLVPTGTVYAYEDADRVWTVREYTYAGADLQRAHHAYVLAPDVADRVDDGARGEPVRGVVNLDKMGVAPGESVQLDTTLGPAPQLDVEDPEIEHVDARTTSSIPAGEAMGVTG